MWLMSSDGKWLGGKRVWLRPGAKYLFGRTSGNARGPNGEQVNYIDHTAVSRKQLVVEIASVQPGDSARVHAKSTVIVTDHSKSGTEINGASLVGKSMTLDGKQFQIKLGKSPVYLTLEWQPVILTFTGVPKSAKANGTALAAERQKLEPLDMKLVTEYVTRQTTHVIAKKRNTVTGLQALVEGRWVVTSGYVDALAAVGENDALELDFDEAWPSEAEHICPKGEEPDPCPDDWLKPKPERAEVFDGYTFITLATSQHSNLMPIITAGRGKSSCYEFKDEETTAQDVIDFVKEAAGHKNSRTYLLSQEPSPGGIIVIRPTEKSASRAQPILSQVDIALNQRSIEQGELLGAVLRADAAILRHSLRDITQNDASLPGTGGPVSTRFRDGPSAPVAESSPVGLPPRSTRGNPPIQQATENAAQPAPVERPRRRVITQKQFKGFDDSDDEDVPSQQAPPSHLPSQPQNHQPNSGAGSAQSSNETSRRSQKRPAPVQQEEEEEETEEQRFDRLMPGQAAMKRRKTEAAARAKSKGKKSSAEATPAPEESPVKETEKPKGKGKRKAKTDIDADLKAKMRANVESREEERRKEIEAMNMTEEEMANVKAEVVTFELPERPAQPVPIETSDGKGKNWDPRWDGRANFKKFRRKGSNQPRKTDSQESQERTLVTLSEVRGKGHGLGDDYWLETGEANQDSQSQSQSGPANRGTGNSSFARGDNDDDELNAFRRRIRRSREEDDDAAAAEAMFDGSAQTSGTQSTLATDTQKAAGKRPAATQLSRPAKKAKQTTGIPSRYADISDDEDPRAFKRKRR